MKEDALPSVSKLYTHTQSPATYKCVQVSQCQWPAFVCHTATHLYDVQYFYGYISSFDSVLLEVNEYKLQSKSLDGRAQRLYGSFSLYLIGGINAVNNMHIAYNPLQIEGFDLFCLRMVTLEGDWNTARVMGDASRS